MSGNLGNRDPNGQRRAVLNAASLYRAMQPIMTARVVPIMNSRELIVVAIMDLTRLVVDRQRRDRNRGRDAIPLRLHRPEDPRRRRSISSGEARGSGSLLDFESCRSPPDTIREVILEDEQATGFGKGLGCPECRLPGRLYRGIAGVQREIATAVLAVSLGFDMAAAGGSAAIYARDCWGRQPN